MTCSDFEDRILESLDGELPAEIESHLRSCEHCRAFREAHLGMDASLAGLAPTELPPHFSARVLARVDRRPNSLPVALDLLGVASAGAAAAFGVALLLPGIGFGMPWVAAALVACAGTWFALVEAA